MIQSLPPAYFEEMYASDPDPWRFETSPYEQAKFKNSIEALGARHYDRALEVGCANGVFTRSLAPRCDSILCLDVSETALAHAHRRNADFPNIQFVKMTFPQQAPTGSFDLIVLSEVVYYWSNSDILAAGSWIAGHTEPNADLLAIHWIGETDYPQTGDNAVQLLRAAIPFVTLRHTERHEKYRLDLWRLPS